jgi:hypothetical protein
MAVNFSPGLKGIEETSEVAVADNVIQYRQPLQTVMPRLALRGDHRPLHCATAACPSSPTKRWSTSFAPHPG